MTTEELVQVHSIVVRPNMLGNGRWCAAMFRRIYLDGGRIDVWPQTHTEAATLDEVVAACALKCVEFVASAEYREAIAY